MKLAFLTLMLGFALLNSSLAQAAACEISGDGYSGGWVKFGSFSKACSKMQAAAGAYVLLLKLTPRGGTLGIQRGLY